MQKRPGYAFKEKLKRLIYQECRSARNDRNRVLQDLCQEGQFKEALNLIEQQGILLVRNNAYLLLQSCEKSKDVEAGRQVLRLMISAGLSSLAVLGDQLIRLFTSVGSFSEANQVFNMIAQPSIYTWSAIIYANASPADGEVGLELYNSLQCIRGASDKYVYVAVIKASTMTLNFLHGRLIHGCMVQNNLSSEVVAGSALIDLYAKCGTLEEACKAFEKLANRDNVSWNAMISAYANHDEALLALECFESMQQYGLKPNEITFSSILVACVSVGAVEQGRLIHDQVLKGGLQLDVVLGGTLVNLYAKSGNLKEAQSVFDKLWNRDEVIWNAIIAGYVLQGELDVALNFLKNMQLEGIKPNEVTLLSIIKTCSEIGSMDQIRYVHNWVTRNGVLSDIIVVALLDMYAKSGSLDQAREMFDKLLDQDVSAWNTMIAGYALHGEGLCALNCFEQMEYHGIKPNKVSCLGILFACSHAGLVDEGHWYFKIMEVNYEIKPSIFHFTRMVDLLGRAGCLHEAESFLLLNSSNMVSWMSLLSACKIHGNLQLGKQCVRQIAYLDRVELHDSTL